MATQSLTMELTNLSSKGQVVIPRTIRQSLSMSPGTKFVVLTDGQNVLLKPLPNSRLAEFKKIITASRQLVKRRAIKQKNLPALIKQTRYAGSA